MEEKNAKRAISDHEFLSLIYAVKKNDPESTLMMIEHFKDDILYMSKFIHMPEEDAKSCIILEFLEFIKTDIEP